MKRALSLMLVAALATLEPLSAAADVEADMATGDRAWAARADGVDERGNARPQPVGEAIAAYERVVAAAPQRIDAHWKRVRALYFAGEFASPDDATSAAWFERARDAIREAIPALDEVVGGDRATSDIPPDEIAAFLPDELHHDVAALHLWSAIAWGAWTRYGGLIAIVRSDVPGKLKRYADVVVALEPTLEHGAAYRLLAALHRSLPRVPFYTGWVDREQAFVELDRAMAISPTFPGNQLLYALTILDLASERRNEALALLEQVAALEPDPEERFEQLAMRAGARDRLAEERGSAVTPWEGYRTVDGSNGGTLGMGVDVASGRNPWRRHTKLSRESTSAPSNPH
jgi:tetratricopeptide (TPR) repeat protein